jgi:hypothetical protein
LLSIVFDFAIRDVIEELIMGGNLIFPIFTLITLVFAYIQKDRIIDTSYYKSFKNRLIDLFEYNFTKYFLLFFVIFVFYFIVCLCILFLSGLNYIFFYKFYRFLQVNVPLVIYAFLCRLTDQLSSWFLPFLYSYFLLSFLTLIYFLFIYKYNLKIKYTYILIGIFLLLPIYLISPTIFFNWEGGIYNYDGSYNWYVIYKLSRYFIIYPIVMIFIIIFMLYLFLYFIKKR